MTYYYYLRDYKNRPLITVCLLKQNGDVARGVAICSEKDNPNKSVGRNIARGRAVQAIKRGATNFDMVRYEAITVLGRTKTLSGEFDFSKSAFNPLLTPLELKMVK